MEKSNLKFAAIALISGVMLVGCNSPAEKAENSRENVVEARKDLADANQKYLEDIQEYRVETAKRIAENDRIIADHKAYYANEKTSTRAANERRIADLELRNTEMKRKMNSYKSDGSANWDNFKREFNRDMDALGKEFKDIDVVIKPVSNKN